MNGNIQTHVGKEQLQTLNGIISALYDIAAYQ